MTVQDLIKLRLISRSCSASSCFDYSNEVLHFSEDDLEKLLYYVYPNEKIVQQSELTSDEGISVKLTDLQIQEYNRKRLLLHFEKYFTRFIQDAQNWVNSVKKIGVEKRDGKRVYIDKKIYTDNDTGEYKGNIYGITQIQSEIKYRQPILYSYSLPSISTLIGLILLYKNVRIGEEPTHLHAHS